jgi:hypothetical protein
MKTLTPVIRKLLSLVILLAAAFTSSYGQDPAAFRIKGIALGITEKEFVGSKIPAVIADSHGRDAGIVIYKSSDDFPPKDVTFTFLDGLLIRFDAKYSSEELKQIGGPGSLKNKLIERLGTPTTSNVLTGWYHDTLNCEDAFWNFKVLGFSMYSQVKNDVLSASLFGVVSKGWEEYKKRREKNANTGF